MSLVPMQWMSPNLCVDEERQEYSKEVLSTVCARPPSPPLRHEDYTMEYLTRMSAELVDRYFFCPAADLLECFGPANYCRPAEDRVPIRVAQLPLDTFLRAVTDLLLQNRQAFLHIGSESGYANFIVGQILGPCSRNHGLESDISEFEASMTRAKEIYVSYPSIRNRTTFPIFFNCHMSEVPIKQKYDRILCSCVTSLSDRRHIANLLRPSGRAILLFEQQEDETEHPRFHRTYVVKDLPANDDLHILESIPHQVGNHSPRRQTKTHNVRMSYSTLRQRCLLAVDKSIRANIPRDDFSSSSITTDWDAVVSTKFESEVKRARGLISRCLRAISSFEREVKTAESNSNGLAGTMTDLKDSLELLTERKSSLFPNRRHLPHGVEPSFSFSVCAVDHLHILTSVMALILEEILNKGLEKHCALSDAEWTSEDQASWTVELNEKWLSTIHRQAGMKRRRNDAKACEAYLSRFDFQLASYFHDMSLNVVFALKRVLSTLATGAVHQLSSVLTSNAWKLQRVTSVSTEELVEEMRSNVNELVSVDRDIGEQVDKMSLQNAEVYQSRMVTCMESLLVAVMSKLKLRNLIRVVSSKMLKQRLFELWWTMRTLEKMWKLISDLRIPRVIDEGSEQPQTINFCAVNAITDRFKLALSKCGVCSRHVWTGMLLLLSRCVRRHLESADRVLTKGENSPLQQYRAKLQSEKLKLPVAIRKMLYQTLPPNLRFDFWRDS